MSSERQYKTLWWGDREVLPGESMRFTFHPNTSQTLRMAVPKIGGDIAPTFGRNRAGHKTKPQRPRTTPESYTIADALIGKLGKREFGKLRDQLNRRTK